MLTLSTQVKVDENRLRERENSKRVLGELLEEIAAARAAEGGSNPKS